MIRILKIVMTLLLIVLVNSCDIVEEPYLQEAGTTPVDTNITKKVLIEDFTGFKCGNCPYAHEVLHSIVENYSDNVVGIAVHAGFFSSPDSKHTYDFQTNVGTEWDNFFGVSNAGLPKGMVGRRGYDESTNILAHDAWEAELISALDEQSIVSIELSAELVGSSTIEIEVDYSYKDGYEEFHNLNVVITEDSIVQYQKWYRHEPEDNYDYVHNHVLRAAVNGDWGEKLTEQKSIKTYTFPIPEGSDWRPEKLNVVAFISDVGGTYEIFQAEEVHLVK